MSFAGINYLAVIIAALAAFGLGAVWYMVLAKPWVRATGKTEAELKKEGSGKALPFIICLLALLVMAWMLAGLVGHIGNVTVRGGMISGAFVWTGFVITTMGVNHTFGGQKPMLTLIDGGYWLAVLVLMGAVIGAFGV
ncbi:MAG: DUF1761 domain-containing protein [Methyloceanibacter sp.]|jgi:hypothetical protein